MIRLSHNEFSSAGTTISESLDNKFVEAIQSHQLRLALWQMEERVDELSPSEQEKLLDVSAAVRDLDEGVSDELTRLTVALKSDMISVNMAGPAQPDRILHVLKFEIPRRYVERASQVLEAHGYQCETRADKGYWDRYQRFFGQAIFWSSSRSQFRVILKWRPIYSFDGRVGTSLRPREADLKVIALPGFCWPAYVPVRLFRRLLGGRDVEQGPPDLGPFLGTPESLILPLLEFAGLKSSDTLVDLGCGDARVLHAAAKEYGCQCRGYETDQGLVDSALEISDAKGVSSLVDVICGDALAADVSDATVVFLFLPVSTMRTLVPELLQKMKPGATLVVHEQERLRIQPVPEESLSMISAEGVTIAHKWVASEGG